LLDLIRFGFATARLEIEDFINTITSEYMMIAADVFIESEMSEQSANITEPDIRVSIAAKDSFQCLRDLAHNARIVCCLRIFTGSTKVEF
jgi:hypothetical protein